MIGALLLAAGPARRFGADKTMTPLRDGTPMALAALRPLRQHADRIIAVVRPGAPVAPLLADHGASLVHVCARKQDLGHSVSTGIAPLIGAGYRGCIVAFADMPLVRGATLAHLADALHLGGFAIAPEYRGTRGWPVAFPAGWFPRLASLSGDGALRHLLAVYRDGVLRLPVDDPGILADVDHPSDLEVLSEPR